MKKRVLSIILALALLICMIPMGMLTASAWTQFGNTISAGSYSGEYYIAQGVSTSLTGTITVPAGKTLALDLNGGYLMVTGAGIAFDVYGTLIIKNSKTAGSCISGEKRTSGSSMIAVQNGGKLQLGGGSTGTVGNIDLKKSDLVNSDRPGYCWGGAVLVRQGGTMDMYDYANIWYCSAGYGGGVLLDGTLNMYGGKFDHCSANGDSYAGGGAVNIERGTFNMSGGAIYSCSATTYGGAVSITKGGTFNMTGGTFSGCSAKISNDQVYVANGTVKDKVTLDKQSGTGGTASVTATNGSAMPAATMPTRSGYTFTGYFDATSGGTKYYNADGTSAGRWDKYLTATLYAQWSKNQTLTYNANGHGTAPAAVTMTYTDEIKAAEAPTATGYTFTGWNTAQNGTGTAYQPGDTVKAANTDPVATTLYAQWSANVYAVTLNTDGTCEPLTDYTYGVGATLPIPAKEKSHFLGWYDNADFTGSPITAIGTTETGDKEFFAKWATVLYEYELTGAPTLGGDKDGTYSISTYYLDDAGEKVYIEKNRNTDVAISFESWYLRTMYQYRTVDGQLDIRFVSMLNDLIDDYAEAGFVFRIDELDWEETVTTNEVYTSFKASEIDQYIADYSRENDYFFLQNTLFSEDVVKEGYTVTVYAFVTTKGGTTYHGAPITIDLADLI